MGTIMGGFFFGIIGMYLFREGKKQMNVRILVISMALMVYPWFVSGALWVWIVGAALSAAAYFVLR